MRTVLTTLALLIVASGVRADEERVTPNDLKQIGLAYHNYADNNAGRAPKTAEDLAPYFENSKKLLDHLKTKRIEFFYGVRIVEMTEGTSNTVLAYEKDVPTKGGYALYGDGSIKKLTADEFKKAMLAKKKQ
jgi:hypothetical protein